MKRSPFAHILGSTSAVNANGQEVEGTAIMTVDYNRLLALLWATLKVLRKKAQEIETTQP